MTGLRDVTRGRARYQGASQIRRGYVLLYRLLPSFRIQFLHSKATLVLGRRGP